MGVLLLNNDFSPLSITTEVRGFNLVFKGRAEIIEWDVDNPIITSIGEFKRPIVIRLTEYIKIPFRTIHLSRNNILKRDLFKCIYCGSKNELTIDHVIPKSRGGNNSWENLVTCCYRCNKYKGQKTPEEVNFVMEHKPVKPNYNYYLTKMCPGFKEEWQKYFRKK